MGQEINKLQKMVDEQCRVILMINLMSGLNLIIWWRMNLFITIIVKTIKLFLIFYTFF